MATMFQVKRFSVDDYAKMVQSGILMDDERVELIDGEVRYMSPIGSRHIGMVTRLTRRLIRLLGDTAIVFTQCSIQLDDFSEPQPDIAVLLWRSDDYSSTKAQPEDVLLLIEVADSSLLYDREDKLPRYAAAGIPEVWIIDLDEDREVIEQYSSPQGRQYTDQSIHVQGDTITSKSLPELINLNVSEVFGRTAG